MCNHNNPKFIPLTKADANHTPFIISTDQIISVSGTFNSNGEFEVYVELKLPNNQSKRIYVKEKIGQIQKYLCSVSID